MSDGMTLGQLNEFEEYYFSVNIFSCTKDEARESEHYRESYWLWERCCKKQQKKIDKLKLKLKKAECFIKESCRRCCDEGFDHTYPISCRVSGYLKEIQDDSASSEEE